MAIECLGTMPDIQLLLILYSDDERLIPPPARTLEAVPFFKPSCIPSPFGGIRRGPSKQKKWKNRLEKKSIFMTPASKTKLLIK